MPRAVALVLLVLSLPALAWAGPRAISVHAIDPSTKLLEEVPLYDRSHALVVGIDDYKHLRRTEQLDTAVHGARAVGKVLRSRYSFPAVRVLDRPAETTRAALYDALYALFEDAGAQDAVLLYFAGHARSEDGGGASRGFLLPSDAGDRPSSWISIDEVRQMATHSKAKHVLVVVDACFSGLILQDREGQPAAERTPAFIRQLGERRGVYAITAGGADERVLDAGEDGHSVFTHHLLERLRSTPDFLLASELGVHLMKTVPDSARRHSATQQPVAAQLGLGEGQFVFAVAPEHRKDGENLVGVKRQLSQERQQRVHLEKALAALESQIAELERDNEALQLRLDDLRGRELIAEREANKLQDRAETLKDPESRARYGQAEDRWKEIRSEIDQRRAEQEARLQRLEDMRQAVEERRIELEDQYWERTLRLGGAAFGYGIVPRSRLDGVAADDFGVAGYLYALGGLSGFIDPILDPDVWAGMRGAARLGAGLDLANDRLRLRLEGSWKPMALLGVLHAPVRSGGTPLNMEGRASFEFGAERLRDGFQGAVVAEGWARPSWVQGRQTPMSEWGGAVVGEVGGSGRRGLLMASAGIAQWDTRAQSPFPEGRGSRLFPLWGGVRGEIRAPKLVIVGRGEFGHLATESLDTATPPTFASTDNPRRPGWFWRAWSGVRVVPNSLASVHVLAGYGGHYPTGDTGPESPDVTGLAGLLFNVQVRVQDDGAAVVFVAERDFALQAQAERVIDTRVLVDLSNRWDEAFLAARAGWVWRDQVVVGSVWAETGQLASLSHRSQIFAKVEGGVQIASPLWLRGELGGGFLFSHEGDLLSPDVRFGLELGVSAGLRTVRALADPSDGDHLPFGVRHH